MDGCYPVHMLVAEVTFLAIGRVSFLAVGTSCNGILQFSMHILIVDEGFIGMSNHLKADSQAQLQEGQEDNEK